ncbi:L-2-amino-thiazoline-4-carboxylic acid hydrolase [Nonomuraea sp. NPDC002799]
MNEQEYRERMRDRLVDYLRLRDELGDEKARETLLARYVELQEQRMGPLIRSRSLAGGFGMVVGAFAELGVRIDIVDVSADGVDAAVEVLSTCECRAACQAAGVAEPLSVLCELDNEATRRAFPELTVEVTHQQARGAYACLFRYSRGK